MQQQSPVSTEAARFAESTEASPPVRKSPQIFGTSSFPIQRIPPASVKLLSQLWQTALGAAACTVGPISTAEGPVPPCSQQRSRSEIAACTAFRPFCPHVEPDLQRPLIAKHLDDLSQLGLGDGQVLILREIARPERGVPNLQRRCFPC